MRRAGAACRMAARGRAPDWTLAGDACCRRWRRCRPPRSSRLAASEELDRGLRRAFWGESRCISLRHVILEVASECESARRRGAGGRARQRPGAAPHLRPTGRWPRATRSQGSPHLFLRRRHQRPEPRHRGHWERWGGDGSAPDDRRRRPGRLSTALSCGARPAERADLTTDRAPRFIDVHLPPFQTADRRACRGAASVPDRLRRAGRGRGLPAGDLHVGVARLPAASPRRQPARLAATRSRSARRPMPCRTHRRHRAATLDGVEPAASPPRRARRR